MNKYQKKLPPEYWVWMSMRQRCLNPNKKGYKNYGGRGIGISPEWSEFAQFMADMGPRPDKTYTLERKDNALGYGKENCCWDTRTAQSWNRRCTRFISFNGETMPIRAWAAKIGVRYLTLYQRLVKYEWPVERALTEEVRTWK